MWLKGVAIRCPELAAGEGQNRPQLRIMLGNCHQVNDKKGSKKFVAPASRRLSRGRLAAGCQQSKRNDENKSARALAYAASHPSHAGLAKRSPLRGRDAHGTAGETPALQERYGVVAAGALAGATDSSTTVPSRRRRTIGSLRCRRTARS
jgi:hypothetical protein